MTRKDNKPIKPASKTTLTEQEAQTFYESWGGKEKFREIFEQRDRSIRFLSSHIKELINQYPDQWVAIYDGEVIGNDKNFNRLIRRLRRKGVDTSHVVIEFLPTQRRPHILLRQAA